MITAIHLGLLVQLFAAGPQADAGPYIRIDRLSPRVALAYWPGIDRRCNLTVIQSQKGLVIIDTEASPRVMAPVKQKIEQTFHRSDWVYVINTHAHDNHASGNSLFPGATIVGHENLVSDMEWLIARRTDPDRKRREVDRYNVILRRPAGRPAPVCRQSHVRHTDPKRHHLLRPFRAGPPAGLRGRQAVPHIFR